MDDNVTQLPFSFEEVMAERARQVEARYEAIWGPGDDEVGEVGSSDTLLG